MNSDNYQEKLIAYYQGVILFYLSANAFQILVFNSDLEIIDLILCSSLLFIFLFRGKIFIDEVKSDKKLINKLYLLIITDIFVSIMAFYILSIFLVLKIGVFLWLLSLVGGRKFK